MDLQLNWWAAGTHGQPGAGAVRPGAHGKSNERLRCQRGSGPAASRTLGTAAIVTPTAWPARMSLDYQIEILP